MNITEEISNYFGGRVAFTREDTPMWKSSRDALDRDDGEPLHRRSMLEFLKQVGDRKSKTGGSRSLSVEHTFGGSSDDEDSADIDEEALARLIDDAENGHVIGGLDMSEDTSFRTASTIDAQLLDLFSGPSRIVKKQIAKPRHKEKVTRKRKPRYMRKRKGADENPSTEPAHKDEDTPLADAFECKVVEPMSDSASVEDQPPRMADDSDEIMMYCAVGPIPSLQVDEGCDNCSTFPVDIEEGDVSSESGSDDDSTSSTSESDYDEGMLGEPKSDHDEGLESNMSAEEVITVDESLDDAFE